MLLVRRYRWASVGQLTGGTLVLDVEHSDCNVNGVADECDLDCGAVGGLCDVSGCGGSIDCDTNGVPDDCEPDCQPNGVVDACDIANGTSNDCNSNDIPDECELHLLAAPMPEPAPVEKVRYVSLLPTNPEVQTALRLRFMDLPGSYDIWNGKAMWVTQPRRVTEQSGSVADLPSPGFTVAGLSCQPDCRDWGSLGVIDVFGEGIVPGGQYWVQSIVCGCDTFDSSNYSDPLWLYTSTYGDLVDQFDGGDCSWTAPNGIVSVPLDTVAAVEKFRDLPCAPRKVRADLVGVPPHRWCVDQKITVVDYVDTVDAFRGLAYPFSPSDPDPCHAIPCTSP